MSGLVAAARTHPGRVRPHNEDALVCEPTRGLLAVIDGMGGEAAGEVAAAITRDRLLTAADPRVAFAEANAAIIARGEANPAEGGMGCVATAAKIDGSRLTIAHVGDTRAYLISAAGLEQLTRDHTVVAEVRERHGMTEEQARALPGQHRVTRDIGGHHREGLDWIDTGEVELRAGDLLLLCSDGLHDLVRDGELSRILGGARSATTAPDAVVGELVELALSRGGHDNITVVVARFEAALERRTPPDRTPPPRTTPAAPATPSAAPRGGRLRVVLALILAVLAFFAGRITAPEPPPMPAPVPIIQPPPPVVWTVPEGQTMTLTAASIHAPLATVEVELAAGARLVLEGGVVVLDAMIVRGAPDAEVRIIGTQLTMRDDAPIMEGPTLILEEKP